LKDQELRNAKWFGEFKSSVYQLAKEFSTFFEINGVFTSKQILRMAEAEFISELLLAMAEGIRDRTKSTIDGAYKKYDDHFPSHRKHEKRFRETIDTIAAILGEGLPKSEFSATRLFYPLFCAVYHLKFGMPRLGTPRISFKLADSPKVTMALEGIDGLIERIIKAEDQHEDIDLSADERKFYNAYKQHWVHAQERTVLTHYIFKQAAKAVRG